MFDHGAALRVPFPEDSFGWAALMVWLGGAGSRRGGAGTVQVATANGPTFATPGDWIVLSTNGDYHVAFAGGGAQQA